MPVVCGACGVENRDAAKFCRSCGARLGAGAQPAADEGEWPVTMPADLDEADPDPGERTVILPSPRAGRTPAPPPAAPAPAAVHAPSPPAPPPSRGKAPLVAGVLAAAVVLAIGAGVYLMRDRGGPTAVAEAPVPALPAPPPVAPPPAPEPPPVAEPPAAPPAPPAPEPAPPVQEAAPPAPAPSPRAAAPRPAAVRKPAPAPVPAPPPPVAEAPAPPAPPPPPPAPEAACAGQNFIARARCLVAECAKPAQRAHPQCEAVRRQQQAEEERRNPTYAN
ncbi:DUF7577 domain-containing protein [Xenophilus azovorans]|uniref:DUF7577 domain-containing protein n=1 Tax=Xenophilus azovorans TaxID=151755 RepID=UPI000571D79F|nr:zinc-ribbon domain-containing protein [Xenophilus azovorans]